METTCRPCCWFAFAPGIAGVGGLLLSGMTACGGAGDVELHEVRVTWRVRYVADAGDTVIPGDWMRLQPSLLVENAGTFTEWPVNLDVAGEVTAEVPDGTYYWFWETSIPGFFVTREPASVLERVGIGRMDAEVPSPGTELVISAGGMSPWAEGDLLLLRSTNVGMVVSGLEDTALSGFPEPGAEALNALRIDLTSASGSPRLLDSSAGDSVAVLHYVPYETTAGFGTRLLELFTDADVNLADGGSATVQGEFTRPPTTWARFDLADDAFADLATSVSPVARRHPVATLVVSTFPDAHRLPLFSDVLSPVAQNVWFAQADSTDVEYANAFGADWDIYVEYGVQYNVPVSDEIPHPLVVWVLVRRDVDAQDLSPVVGPPRAPRINGADLFVTQTAVGEQPLIAWEPPLVGDAARYGMTILRIRPDASPFASRRQVPRG